MAQIRIEEKSAAGGPNIWPWVIGLLLLGLVVWGVAEAFDESEEVYTEEVVEDGEAVSGVATGIDENNNYNDYASTGEEESAAVSTYLNTTADMEGEMGLGHDFTHRALSQLAAATSALAQEQGLLSEASVRDKTDRVNRLADEIRREPMADTHADNIKMAAMLITEILEDVDERAFANGNAGELASLRQEAQAIDAETLTLDQKADVRSFFTQARTVIERMQ